MILLVIYTVHVLNHAQPRVRRRGQGQRCQGLARRKGLLGLKKPVYYGVVPGVLHMVP